MGSSHRAVQNASLAWGWLRMVRPYSSTLGQPSQAVFLPCMWGQLHAIYLYLQMKTILHYNDLQFEKQFVAKQNMDSNDSDCPTRPFLTREFRLRCRKRNTILNVGQIDICAHTCRCSSRHMRRQMRVQLSLDTCRFTTRFDSY